MGIHRMLAIVRHCARSLNIYMRFAAIVLALLVPVFAVAQGDFFTEFFVGDYLLVGKGLNTNKTYTGKVEIYRENGALKLKIYE